MEQEGDSSNKVWSEGYSADVGEKYATWSTGFAEGKLGESYIVHLYAYDKAGNETTYTLSPILLERDLEKPQLKDITYEQKENEKVQINIALRDNMSLGEVDVHRLAYYSTDTKSSSFLDYAGKKFESNINCWTFPIIKKECSVQRIEYVQCDGIIGLTINVSDLAGNETGLQASKSGHVKGIAGRSIEQKILNGESVTIGELREKLGITDAFDVCYDKRNERILKKIVPETSSDIDDVILTGNDTGTEYVYFVNLFTGMMYSCKVDVQSNTSSTPAVPTVSPAENTPLPTTAPSGALDNKQDVQKQLVKPGRVVISGLKSYKAGKLVVRIKGVPTADYYEIQYSQRNDFIKNNIKKNYGIKKKLSLLRGKTFYIRVRAVRYGNNITGYKDIKGKWSKVKK